MFQLLSCKLLKCHLPPTNKSSVITVTFHEYVDKLRFSEKLAKMIYIIQGGPKKTGISKSMYIALRAIKIKQIKF